MVQNDVQKGRQILYSEQVERPEWKEIKKPPAEVYEFFDCLKDLFSPRLKPQKGMDARVQVEKQGEEYKIIRTSVYEPKEIPKG